MTASNLLLKYIIAQFIANIVQTVLAHSSAIATHCYSIIIQTPEATEKKQKKQKKNKITMKALQ